MVTASKYSILNAYKGFLNDKSPIKGAFNCCKQFCEQLQTLKLLINNNYTDVKVINCLFIFVMRTIFNSSNYKQA